jgi:iron complex transport system permease protein
MRTLPPRLVVALLLAATAAAFVAALAIGSVGASPGELWQALVGGTAGTGATGTTGTGMATGAAGVTGAGGGAAAGTDPAALALVVHALRLPRALAAFAVGALLALAGAILQALLRNALADPYVLGISGGAAVAALLALSLGAATWVAQGASAAGALLALALLFALARRAFFVSGLQHGEETTASVMLTGVMIAAFSSAGLSLLLSLATDMQLRGMVFWLLGDLTAATDLKLALLALGAVVLLLGAALTRARALDLMLRGDLLAFTQGVDVTATRRVLVVIAACATGVAVTLAGAVGFVGFVAPHVMRLLLGNAQRVLLPAAALAGGLLVLVADTVARSVLAPISLPVGVVTAMIGVPVFLWLLRRQ